MVTLFTTLFLTGLIGLLALTFLGIGHGGHDTGHGHDAGHGHSGHDASQGHQGHGDEARVTSSLWALLSPVTLFSLCLGVGATGLLLRPLHWTTLLTILAAAGGGLAFYSLIVRPLWGTIFKFASTPSRALEGTVAQTAEALSHFDAGGKGLVRLSIDGQFVRVLATLEADDRTEAVRPGDKLLITGVDGRANTCRVSRL